MYQDIRNNKIKTGFIVSLFVIVIALIIYYICMAFDLGYMSIIIAMIFSIASAWASYYYSDKIVLSINKAHPASSEQYQKLNNILDGLMVSSGLSDRPKLYVVDDQQPNAFATGRNPKNAVICVTTGLLEKMDYYELEGVIAHELSHIKNYDIRLSAVVSVMVGFMVILTDWVSRALFWGRFSDDDNKAIINAINAADPDLLWIGMTAPKQEKWAYEHWDELNIHCHVGTIGAVFDFFAGTVERAPEWWQKHGLEWLYRLIKEPRRMWKRYIIGNTLFLWNIFKEKFSN